MAKERGVFAATLETFTFQAPDFYAKRGDGVFGRSDDYPPEHAKQFLSQRLIDSGGLSMAGIALAFRLMVTSPTQPSNI